MRRLKLGIIMLSLMVLFALVFASEGNVDIDKRLASPSAEYIWGCDSFGRPLLERLSYGFLVSLVIGAIASATALAISLLIAFLLVRVRCIRLIILAFIDGIRVIPTMVFALFLASVAGPGAGNIVFAAVLAFVPGVARTFYSLMGDAYTMPYIEAAYSAGSGECRVFIKHIFPYIRQYLMEEFTSLVLSAILIESSLSFIGAGVDAAMPSMGLILQEARPYMLTYPHMTVFPSLALILLSSSLLLISCGLRELDPASHRA